MGRSVSRRPSIDDFDSLTASPAHPWSVSKHKTDSTLMTRTPQA